MERPKTDILVEYAGEGLRNEPHDHFERDGDARAFYVPADGFERVIAAREYRMRMHEYSLIFHLGKIALERRDLEDIFFFAEEVLLGVPVVVADFHILDRAERFEHTPVDALPLTEAGQLRNYLLAAVKDEKKTIVNLYRFHGSSF